MKTLPAGVENLHIPSDEDRKRMYEIANATGSGGDSAEGKRKWRRGEIEFEAFMRHLDNAVSAVRLFLFLGQTLYAVTALWSCVGVVVVVVEDPSPPTLT